MFNKYYYSNVLKYNSFKHTTNTGLGKRDSAKIESLGKVSFLLGTSKLKKRKNSNWKELIFVSIYKEVTV